MLKVNKCVNLTSECIEILIWIACSFMRLGYTDSTTQLFDILKYIQGFKCTNVDVIGAYTIYLIQMCATDKA